MRIRDWSSDVCSSDLAVAANHAEMAVDFAQANQAAVDRLIDASARARFLAGLAASSNDPAMIAKLERIAEIGRASCRERVWQYVSLSGAGGAIKKQHPVMN